MSVMTEVARRHNFRVLFHEKPFAGINGSGKHNNWSLGTDRGAMLFSPGKLRKTICSSSHSLSMSWLLSTASTAF